MALRCQRIGCSASFTPGEEGGCTYHPSAPSFHDGTRSWPCCNARGYDFDSLLAIPGCTQGELLRGQEARRETDQQLYEQEVTARRGLLLPPSRLR